ncbi:uncharacterized protein METZ01_LOCUS196508, partial [marine metagenome]
LNHLTHQYMPITAIWLLLNCEVARSGLDAPVV